MRRAPRLPFRVGSMVLVSVAAMAIAPRASAHFVSGYAVANHRNCGAVNLASTLRELDKFYASPDFPEDAAKNVLWTDAQVRAGDWAAHGDYRESRDAAGGFDGADASFIAYLATHGATSDGRYQALAGSGTCAIRSGDLALGDQAARYLILSTSESLKIGTGDDPTRRGEDPARTWKRANAGLNCIFGYSNNLVDSDLYGAEFLHALAASDAPLAQAFFRASRDVAYDNVPAVLCYGADAADARRNVAAGKRFSEERFGQAASAVVYERARRRADVFEMPATRVPRVVVYAEQTPRLTRWARALLGPDAQERGSGAGRTATRGAPQSLWGSPRGIMTHDASRGLVTWRAAARRAPLRQVMLSDADAGRIARDFVRSKGLVTEADGAFTPTYVVDRGLSAAGTADIVAKTVVLHQRLKGLSSLTPRGSVEVTVDADGTVSGVALSLLSVALPHIPEWIDPSGLTTGKHRQIALERLQRLHPAASLTVVQSRVGYDLRATGKAFAVVEVVVEAEVGGFARRYAEKIPL